MTPAGRTAAVATVALAALQFAWHGVLAPPATVSPWLLATVFAAPLAPALVLFARRHPLAGFAAALPALLYFCHGVMLAWAAPEVRLPALAEAALSAVLIVAASWDGLRRRLARRTAPPAV